MAGYETVYGKCICGDSKDLLLMLKDESVDLFISSPPFALQRGKAYGNQNQDEYAEWLCTFGKIMHKKLRKNGSVVFDIGGAYKKGVPEYSLYQFRTLIKLCDEVGFKLAQPFYWHNTTALPSPVEWVNVRKLRAKTSVNTIWWLCKDSLNCKANISKVLTPYSKRMKQMFEKPEDFYKSEQTKRPSEYIISTLQAQIIKIKQDF